MFVRLLSLLAMAATLVPGPAAPSQWDWIYPVPHRQSWIDLASGSNGYVGLTDGYGGRQLYYSATGADWEAVQMPPNPGLRQVTFANGSYIAVGNQDVIISSPDGIDWQVRHTNPTGSMLFDVAYGKGAYVAVGYNSVALFSKDLKTWSPLDFPKGYSLLNIEFGNGIFLAVASSGTIYRSTDGRGWTALPWPSGLTTEIWSSLESGFAFNNGTFVLGVPGGGATTADGVNWTVTTEMFYRKIVAAGDGFIASSSDTLAVSNDGANWDDVVSLPNSSGPLFNGLAKLNDRWLACGYGGLLYGSTDGANWEPVVKPVDFTRGNIAHANGAFIRYGFESGHFVSGDGRTWTFNENAPDLHTLAGGNGVWVGINGANNAAVSTDGATWQEVTLPARPYGEVMFANDVFLCAAEGGLLVSDEGKDWELVNMPNIKSIRLIGFQNGIIAAMSDAWEPMTSADGRNWTVHSARPDLNAHFFAAGNGRFVGIGSSGMGYGDVIWSTDGVNWQRQNTRSGSTYMYTGLEFGGGYFLMIDGSGGAFYSTDGITWSGGRQAAQAFTGAAYGDGAWVIVGGDSVLRSSDRFVAKMAATLQITKSDFSNWNLVVSGSAGEKWQIEAAASLDTEWGILQTVEIPVAGRINVPLAANQSTAFFRAAVQP